MYTLLDFFNVDILQMYLILGELKCLHRVLKAAPIVFLFFCFELE